VIYFLWDTWAYKHEPPQAIVRDETEIQPMRIAGAINMLWLLGVVAAVALLDPSKPVVGTNWVPVVQIGSYEFVYIRECAQLLMALLSWITTQLALRKENEFNFGAIGEVACLFIGIFITMQVPIELLNAKGAELGLREPWQFFWASGTLSSFLDNAPTYVVYFETAVSLQYDEAALAAQHIQMMHLPDGRTLPISLLIAVSCGSVFMGANTYIGNGPNFMVKAIAEQSGVKMPSFFGYMLYSGAILIPLFVILTLVFFRG
jgi:Na+/H+ antiporter NhaD/arsenite permease-like protein